MFCWMIGEHARNAMEESILYAIHPTRYVRMLTLKLLVTCESEHLGVISHFVFQVDELYEMHFSNGIFLVI